MSSAVARRSTKRSSSWASCTVPARQGTHLPQLSLTLKPMKWRATSGMEVLCPITTMPPEPIIEPSSSRLS